MCVRAVASQGDNSSDARRIERLLRNWNVVCLPFDRARKRASAVALLRTLRREKPDLVVLEGTGLAAGIPILVGRLLFGVPYIVSTGDAVGPYLAASHNWIRVAAWLYERSLYRRSAGVIGWTPYLVGRAIGFGARRAMTAEGFVTSAVVTEEDSAALRAELSIPHDAIVVGIIGSLTWNKRYNYCYGTELVRAAETVTREDVYVLIVGGGDGHERLVARQREHGLRRVVFTGQVPPSRALALLHVLDVGVLPQSVDRVGAYRYTIKLSEYLAAGIPVVTNEIPLSYDIGLDWTWRLPGDAPWDDRYVGALSQWMSTVTRSEIRDRKCLVPKDLFDEEEQIRRVTAFISDAIRDLA